MSDGQPPPRAIAIVQLSGGQWIGQRYTPELGRTAVLLGSVAELDLEQACGRWARTLRRRGWLLTADWSTTQARRWASVPIRPLAELLHQQLLLGPPAEDWPMRANRQLRSCRGQAGTPPRRRTATTPWPV